MIIFILTVQNLKFPSTKMNSGNPITTKPNRNNMFNQDSNILLESTNTMLHHGGVWWNRAGQSMVEDLVEQTTVLLLDLSLA